MKNVKFIGNDKKQKEFAVALRKNVHNYFLENNISTKGNGKMYLKAFLLLSLFLSPLVIILTLPVPAWGAWLLAMMMGVGGAGVGMGVMHDANHGSFSDKEWVNKLMGNTMYLLGSNKFNWVISHNVLHHVYTNINGLDVDMKSRGVIRFSEHAPINKSHKTQHIHAFFLYSFLTIYKFINDPIQLREYYLDGTMAKHDRKPVSEFIKLFVSKCAYLFMVIGLPLLFTPFAWWQVLIGFVSLHMVAGVILGVTFQLAHVVEEVDQPIEDEHDVIENDWLIHELETTTNFAKENKLLYWYVGGLNYQVEHHLFPSVSHVHYPDIAPIVEKTVKEYGFKYHTIPTLGDAIRSHIRKLKKLGTLPSLVNIANG